MMLLPITNLPRKQLTTLRPRVKAEATEDPIKIIGPSGPENRQADTVTIVPNSFTNTVLQRQGLVENGLLHGGGGVHLKRKRLGTCVPLR